MKKRIIALMMAVGIAISCGTVPAYAMDARVESDSKTNANEKFEFYTLSGLVFAYLKEWAISEEADDHVIFKPDDSTIISIRVVPKDSRKNDKKFLEEYGTQDASKHSDYQYEVISLSDHDVLTQYFVDNGLFGNQNIAVYDDLLIFTVVLSKEPISPDTLTRVAAMVIPVGEEE